MNGNLSSYKEDLEKLIAIGDGMVWDLRIRSTELNGESIGAKLAEVKEQFGGSFERDYQLWYTEALSVIRQLIPDRLEEFEQLYKVDKRRKTIDLTTYTIQDWINGFRSTKNGRGEQRINDLGIVSVRCSTQLDILKAANSRFESSLYDLKQLVQADLFDSELDTAKELISKGFLRASGAIAGVVLERHLSQVCGNHSIPFRKKTPVISDYYEALKGKNVIDVPTWRFIQRLGDLRNLCDHDKDREPTKEEAEELISGVDKVSKTVF